MQRNDGFPALLPRGACVLSIDVELAWGTFDHGGYAKYHKSFDRVRPIVTALLERFREHQVRATWAVVGHLFLESCRKQNGVAHPELVRAQHDWFPEDWLSRDPGSNLEEAPHWYGRDLIEQIAADSQGHEIGSHSFSHVIFGDAGCSREAARSELAHCTDLAQEVIRRNLRSFVFPRNAPGHLGELRDAGFQVFRGPDPWWFEKLPSRLLRRAGHFADDLLMLRPPVVQPVYVDPPGLWNVPGSMLYQSRHGLRRLIPIEARVRKAKRGIRSAIEQRKVFHLWFHPFNLADDEAQLLDGLERILAFAEEYRSRGELDILTMGELAERCEAHRDGGGSTSPSVTLLQKNPLEVSKNSEPVSRFQSDDPAVRLHDEQAELFDRRYELLEQNYYQSAFTYGRKQVDGILEQWLGEGRGQRLLDVGCGTGFHLARWRNKGFVTYGLEPASAMLTKARKQAEGCRFVQGDAQRLPLADDSFDVVLSIEVLRYLTDPVGYLGELHRVLRPGGMCVFTAAPRYSLHGFALAHRLSRHLGLGRYAKVRHRFDTVGGLERQCRRVGFSEVEVRGAFLGPFVVTEKIAPRASEWVLRRWETSDTRLSARRAFRNVCNHLVVRAVKL